MLFKLLIPKKWELHFSIFLATGILLALLPPVWAQELLTQEAAIQTALQNNYSILIAKNEAQITENNHSLGNAGFLPRLDLGARQNKSITDSKQNYVSGNVIDRNGAVAESKGANALLSWTIFDGFKMFIANDKLGVLENMGELQLKMAVEQTVADVIEAYNDIIQQKLRLQVAEEAVSISTERLKIAEVNLQIGAGSRLEMLQASVDLNSDQSALMNQKVAYENAKIRLNQLLARPVATVFAVQPEIELLAPLSPDEIQAQTWRNNSLLKLTAMQIRVAEMEFKETRSERLPELNVSVGYDLSRSESQAGFMASSQSAGLSYGATLSLNLFNGFDLHRREQNARLIIHNSKASYNEVKELVAGDCARLCQTYHNSLELVALEKSNLQAAEENVQISMEQFRQGSITPLTLREAQRNYSAAQSRLISAQYAAKQAETELLKLSGGLVKSVPD